MTSGANRGALGYDPLMRFYQSGPTYFIHEGGQLIGDYYNGNIVGRYVPGAAGDEPVALIDKFGARTGFHADERGSIIAGSNAAGANARIVTYDEYGKPSLFSSRFLYAGKMHFGGASACYDNARFLPGRILCAKSSMSEGPGFTRGPESGDVQ